MAQGGRESPPPPKSLGVVTTPLRPPMPSYVIWKQLFYMVIWGYVYPSLSPRLDTREWRGIPLSFTKVSPGGGPGGNGDVGPRKHKTIGYGVRGKVKVQTDF